MGEDSRIRQDIGKFKYESKGTLGTDVLSVARQMTEYGKPYIWYFANSNKPTNRPSNCDWGSYIFLTDGTGLCTILYLNNANIASTAINSAATSITWHIV